MTKLIGLIDGDILMYRICFSIDPDADLNTIKAFIDEYIKNLFNKMKITHYIGILGFNGGDNPRYLIYPEYKRGRPADKPPHWKKVMNYLITKWKFVPVSGVETDDVLALCASVHKMFDTIICSSDKDLKQIPGLHYRLGLNRKGVVIKEDKRIGIGIKEAMLSFYTQMLVGDSVDNIKGIPGCGPKTAEKILIDAKSGFQMRDAVREAYEAHFGEDKGEEEFMINEALLKISPLYANEGGIECPEPVLYREPTEEQY